MRFDTLRQFILGKPLDPLERKTRRHIALIAFFAWIGLGADGLSSSCYGPEQAFYALGAHTHLAIYLALATALTVFLIAFAYNQVIQLFPNGGGGYKVATQLLGRYAGLVSGAALIVDYVLTIAISIASGTDALFSLLPYTYQRYKLALEVLILICLALLNLRGAKETIKVLIPVFLGFFITHLLLISIGVAMHGSQLQTVILDATQKSSQHLHMVGFLVLAAFFLRAYSLGAGTYTGIEAVSNNIQILAEPRVRTGAWTMFYMALSLSLTAGGIILLYLLWHVTPVPGQTLNAVVFHKILVNFPYSTMTLTVVLALEAGLLFVAANTGFLGGPAVLANMSIDRWVPRRFSLLSNRLVTQNGIILFTIAALVILLGTDGDVTYLVVLYSMNVFLTFSTSLLGLTRHWWQNRRETKHWITRFVFCAFAFIVCVSILLTTLIEKFEIGGWITIFITSAIIILCLFIHKHYKAINALKTKLNKTLAPPLAKKSFTPVSLDPQKPTAVFLVKGIGAAMHSLLWVHKIFPNYFKNFIFVSHGVVDIGSFGSERKLKTLQKTTQETLNYLIAFCNQKGFAAESFESVGTDPIEDIAKLAKQINERYPHAIYFATRYIYPTESWVTRILHSDLAPIIEKRLHVIGAKMLILPLHLNI